MNRPNSQHVPQLEALETRRMFVAVPLILNGTEGNDVISVGYTRIQSGYVYHIWVNGELYEPYNPQISEIIINGGGGNDNLTLEDLRFGLRAQVNGGAGNDTINVGEGYWGNFGVDGRVMVDGGSGTDKLNIDDHSTSSPAFDDRYVLTGSSFKWGGYNSGGALSFTQPTTFYNTENLDIRCNNGPSYIEVTDIAAGVHVSLQTGDGANEIRLGSGDMDSQFLGSLTVFGQGGSDKAYFFDQDDTGNDTYTINSSSILKNGMGTLSYYGIEQWTLWGNNFNNSFVVNGTHQDTTNFEIRGTGGNDGFYVGNGQLANAIRGKLTLKGDAGTNTVELRDQTNSTNSAYQLNDGTVTRNGFSNKLNYINMQTVKLYAGTGADAVVVRPSVFSEFVVQGNYPITTVGDRIEVDEAGATGMTQSVAGSTSGWYTFANRKQILYSGFESTEYAPPPVQPTSELSDRAWTSATNAWGPVERDKSNGEQAAGDGHTLTLNGQTYTNGLGVHAGSDITFAIGGQGWTRFQTDIGVDDEVGNAGSVVFQVWLDGVKVFDSGVMSGASATQHLDLSVSGKNTLRLVVTDAGNGNASDHADWANARLVQTANSPITGQVVLAKAVSTTTQRIAAALFGSA
jgi:hypothetical protein